MPFSIENYLVLDQAGGTAYARILFNSRNYPVHALMQESDSGASLSLVGESNPLFSQISWWDTDDSELKRTSPETPFPISIFQAVSGPYPTATGIDNPLFSVLRWEDEVNFTTRTLSHNNPVPMQLRQRNSTNTGFQDVGHGNPLRVHVSNAGDISGGGGGGGGLIEQLDDVGNSAEVGFDNPLFVQTNENNPVLIAQMDDIGNGYMPVGVRKESPVFSRLMYRENESDPSDDFIEVTTEKPFPVLIQQETAYGNSPISSANPLHVKNTVAASVNSVISFTDETSDEVLASNADRVGLSIFVNEDSVGSLYVLFGGGTASSSNYSLIFQGGQGLLLFSDAPKFSISAIFIGGTGTAVFQEFLA